MQSVKLIESWPVDNASTVIVSRTGDVLSAHGDQGKVFPLASVTKLLTAYGALIAIEEQAIGLDDAAGPEGSTVRHLLAHASGLDFDTPTVRFPPGARRIYSNYGFEILAEHVTEKSGIAFADYVREGLLTPLGMSATTFQGSPAAGASSSTADLARFAAELHNPVLVSAGMLAQATTVVFPGLDGVLPGFGRQTPNDWGLGFEIRGSKTPHWMGTANSPAAFGHFGQTGTFLWLDPEAGVACVALTDRNYGRWAAAAWPGYSDAVLDEIAAGYA